MKSYLGTRFDQKLDLYSKEPSVFIDESTAIRFLNRYGYKCDWCSSCHHDQEDYGSGCWDERDFKLPNGHVVRVSATSCSVWCAVADFLKDHPEIKEL